MTPTSKDMPICARGACTVKKTPSDKDAMTTTNPTNAYTVPSVSITTARTGASSKANALGMRAMQEPSIRG